MVTPRRQLRVMLIATALLLVSQAGQFIIIRVINTQAGPGWSSLAAVAQIFLVPTAVILTAAIMWSVRKRWREHEKLMLLGAINLLIALNLVWFFVNACNWAQVFGLALRSCR